MLNTANLNSTHSITLTSENGKERERKREQESGEHVE